MMVLNAIGQIIAESLPSKVLQHNKPVQHKQVMHLAYQHRRLLP